MSNAERITVRASTTYDVVIGRSSLGELGEWARQRGGKFAIVTDTNVGPHHLSKVRSVLEDAAVSGVCSHTFAAGEASKNISTLSAILEFLAESELCRSDTVIALGGGVVGDITALAAALYMRGVSYIQIPTSVVAAVDSSVGGKCAVDLRAGKNLAGVFKQPSLVVCDPDMLDTLPDCEVSCGMAEVIKYGLGFDADLFAEAAKGGREAAYSLIARCVDIKRRVVEEDEFDHGERMKLNLGHTAGHAIERLSDFSIPHGAAVGMGLYIMTRAFLPEKAEAVERALEANGLAVHAPFSARDIARAALGDKKRSGDFTSLIVPTAIGSCEIRRAANSELEDIFRRGTE